MTRGKVGIFLFLLAAAGVGCSTPVLKQEIPVSTNPMGAVIYADGQVVGQSPGTVSLERNRDHLVTLLKDEYRQVDVPVRRQYQSQKVLMKAVQSGVNSSLFFNNPQMGFNSGFNSISYQEESGEAYVLAPSVIQVSLPPIQSTSSKTSGSASGGQIPAENVNGPVVMESEAPPSAAGPSAKDLVKAGVAAGAAAAVMANPPNSMQKTWETSSSSKTYVQPDGTRVTEKSGTSVGVGVNVGPAAVGRVLDMLFK